jgi:hypothetical protein
MLVWSWVKHSVLRSVCGSSYKQAQSKITISHVVLLADSEHMEYVMDLNTQNSPSARISLAGI